MPTTTDELGKPALALWRQRLAFGCTALVLTGLFTFHYFRLLSGLGIAGLVVLALFQPGLGLKMKGLFRQKLFLGFLLIFLFHGLTLLYTGRECYPQWWTGMLLKLPFLFLPLALSLLAPWPARSLTLLYYFFFHLVFFAALYSLGQYWQHYQEINQSYHRAGVMPTLVNHVRFSLMTAFAVFIGIRLCWQGYYWRYPWERYWIGGVTLLLFFFLHVLAVRSGLLAFYTVLCLALAYWLLVRKKLKIALGALLLLVMVPVMSLLFLPTVKEKLGYTLYDLAQRNDETKANNYSLTGRLYSYRVGLAVWQQSPVWGQGLGHMSQALAQTYKSLFPGIRPAAYLIPHNQYLYYLGLLGGLGLAVFLAGFYYPLVAFVRQTDVLFGIHYLIITVSFLFEATLETQVGLIYSLLFILLPLKVVSGKW